MKDNSYTSSVESFFLKMKQKRQIGFFYDILVHGCLFKFRNCSFKYL